MLETEAIRADEAQGGWEMSDIPLHAAAVPQIQPNPHGAML